MEVRGQQKRAGSHLPALSSRDLTQIVGLGSGHLYPLSQYDSPTLLLNDRAHLENTANCIPKTLTKVFLRANK